MSQIADNDTSLLSLPFHTFILICDLNEDIHPRSAQTFQKILAHHPVGMSELFNQMLDFCRDNYPTLWRDYTQSKLPINFRRLLALLNYYRSKLSPTHYENLKRDLIALARKLYQPSFLFSPSPSQKEAYHEFRDAVQQGVLPLRVLESLELEDESATTENADSTQSVIAENLVASKKSIAANEHEQKNKSSLIATSTIQRNDETSPANVGEGQKSSASIILMPKLPEPGAIWTKGPIKLVCVKITDEAKHVKTFSFAGSKNTLFRYQPGQFLTIEPIIDEKVVHRSYTISSTPTRPGLLEITVKRVSGGLVSNWLHDNMTVGQELSARGPAGKFSCVNFPHKKYLLLSAGSGITPVMSMLRYLHDLAATSDIVFLHLASTQADIIFRKELTLYMGQNPRIRVCVALSQEPAESSWNGLRGRIDNDLLHRAVPDFLERMVLSCGPTGFMEKMRQLLIGNNFPMATQFDEESFTPPKGPKKEETKKDVNGTGGKLSKVIFVKSGKTTEISPGETILEAAERCGVEIPNSCRKGSCGTCRISKLSGDVLMSEQEALSTEEIAQGDILACVCQPKSQIIEVEI